MKDGLEKRNLNEFKYRLWLPVTFMNVCFIIAIIIVENIAGSYIATLQAENATAETIDAVTRVLNMFSLIMMTMIILGIVGGITITFLLRRNYLKEWDKIKPVLSEIAKGNSPTLEVKTETEFAVILETATKVGEIYDGLQLLRDKISKGEFEDDMDVFDTENSLGKSGVLMLNNLKDLTENNNLRLWVNESLNELSEIMRKNRQDLDIFSQNILSFIVKKVKANIAAMYVINETENSHPYMEMLNCYAYDKVKHLESRIYMGEGQIGRLWQERKSIAITDIPEDYCNIVTGVGEIKPRAILFIPMILDEKIVGAIEIAGLAKFAPHQEEFIQKAVNSFAAVFSNMKVEENTKHLLEEAQQLSEETRASEEEIRQNMEELQAIQEELLRKEKETDKLMLQAKDRERNLQEEIDRLQTELLNAK